MQIGYLADHEEFLPELVKWHHDEWAYLRPCDTIEARTGRIRACCGRLQIPTVFVAFSNSEFVGSAMLMVHDMDTRMELSPWLGGVLVVPSHRRRGIGTMLVERAFKEATALGINRIYLYTFSTEKYYANLGWSVFERTRYFGEDVVVMAKEIRPNKSPEPTPGSVTPRAMGMRIESKPRTARSNEARVVPAPVVAHL